MGGVDLTLLQRRDHGVRVGEEPVDDPVDVGILALPTPVVGVGLHGPVLAPVQLGEGVGPRGHAVGGLVGPQLVGRDVLVDVLGDDVHVHRRQLGIGHRADELEGDVVDGRRLEVGGRGEVVEPLLVPRAVDRVGHVVGRERFAVGPLEPLAERVGPGQPILGTLPGLGQPRDGLEVVRRLVGQRGVHQVPDLVGRHRVPDRDIGRVDLLGDPDGERDLLVVGPRRRRGGVLCGRRCEPKGHRRQNRDEADPPELSPHGVTLGPSPPAIPSAGVSSSSVHMSTQSRKRSTRR